MSKSKVYTYKGDKGFTSLVDGTKVSKFDRRIECYGEVDELNSFIGLLICELENEKEDIELLKMVQNQLFNMGSLLATPSEKREEFKLPQVSTDKVKDIEARIDAMDASLPALKNFILPGGSKSSGYAHVCRTICRRVERNLVSVRDIEEEYVTLEMLAFINRLSDYFFVFSRFLNHALGVKDEIWKP